MAFDARNNSAVSKRAEQLKRWEDSDTNRASNLPKDPSTRKVKFSSGCVFLAACLSGDKDDILRLIENGVDIDTANVDGLTALHQVNVPSKFFILFFSVWFGFSSQIRFVSSCVSDARRRVCANMFQFVVAFQRMPWHGTVNLCMRSVAIYFVCQFQ